MVSFGERIATFRFAQLMILGRLKFWFHSCAHASNLSSVGSPTSTTRKGPDNRRDGVARFDVLPSQKPSVVQIESSLLSKIGTDLDWSFSDSVEESGVNDYGGWASLRKS